MQYYKYFRFFPIENWSLLEEISYEPLFLLGFLRAAESTIAKWTAPKPKGMSYLNIILMYIELLKIWIM